MLQKFCLGVVLVSMLASNASSVALAANTSGREHLVYDVHHSKYGKIGTYTNLIEYQGDTTNVTTAARLSVSVLGVNMYRQDVSRREIWRGNRIVEFHGVTTENGKTVEVNGKVESDHFVIMTPNGTTSAPADLRLANPWSREAVDEHTMLTPDLGRLETVTIGLKCGTRST